MKLEHECENNKLAFSSQSKELTEKVESLKRHISMQDQKVNYSSMLCHNKFLLPENTKKMQAKFFISCRYVHWKKTKGVGNPKLAT